MSAPDPKRTFDWSFNRWHVSVDPLTTRQPPSLYPRWVAHRRRISNRLAIWGHQRDYARMMEKLFLCLTLIFAAAPCMAQEYLEPNDAPLIAAMPPRIYGSDYGRKLKPEIGGDVRIFAIVEGGLVPDFAVGLKRASSGYRIFTIGETRTSGLNRCEAAIENDLARDIIFAWDKVLRQTRRRVGQPQGGADVPFHHFGSHLPSGLVMGQVWDTPPNSNPAQLARISSGLLQICSGGRVQPIPEALAEIRIALGKIH
jgi:hypothetical protein